MFEVVPSVSNPCTCHALSGLVATTDSFHCTLTSVPEPALLPSKPNWLTSVLLVSLTVSVKNAVSNVNSPPPEPVNKEPCLISKVEPDGNVNVFPDVKVVLLLIVCKVPDVNLKLASALESTSFIAATRLFVAEVVKLAFVPI